jgi:small-conductance mechanosensitive channel/CRP-like cAMP-binding protein
MTEFWTEPWFGWAIAVAVGLPVLIIVLTEIIGWLTRRGHPAAKPVMLLRNLVLPVGALLVLLSFANEVTTDFTWIRVVATVFGFLVILLVLSAFNVVLFGTPRAGTWRDRLPSIFVDIARLVLIVLGLAVLFSWVWGADVGGLFAALGVTSIVLGLALQGAIGSVVSGLLLLFEQPFRLGDWLDTGSVRGRVVEVNWRSVHIETDDGVQIVPNATLAGASFTNLSRTDGAFMAEASAAFAVDDPPHVVIALLRQVAADLPLAAPGEKATVSYGAKGAYSVGIPVLGPAAAEDAVALFSAWLWYAARRAGLTLDGSGADPANTPENVRGALDRVAPTLRLPADDIDALVPKCRLDRYTAGEVVQREGEIASAIQVIVSGRLDYSAVIDDARVHLSTLEAGDYVGQTALTRERTLARATAETPLTVLRIDTAVIDSLVGRSPALAREISQTIDRRRAAATAAIAALAGTRPPFRR